MSDQSLRYVAATDSGQKYREEDCRDEKPRFPAVRRLPLDETTAAGNQQVGKEIFAKQVDALADGLENSEVKREEQRNQRDKKGKPAGGPIGERFSTNGLL